MLPRIIPFALKSVSGGEIVAAIALLVAGAVAIYGLLSSRTKL